MAWAARRRTDPLLVDVGQEQAVLLVEVVVQGVVPVLRLHKAAGHKVSLKVSRNQELRTTYCFWTASE